MQRSMDMKTVAFYTLGCKVNQYETEGIISAFKEYGYEIKSFDDICDVYVINTCSVTSSADRKARTLLAKAKNTNPNSIVALCGCYTQTNPETKKLKGADIIIGSSNKASLPRIIQENSKLYFVPDIMKELSFEEYRVEGHSGKTRAFMKIQDGCDNYCAYCIIPYARGHIRSRKPENIIKEARTLVKNGYTEIILTGIHITSYGKDLEDFSLLDVLLMLHEVEGLKRIRLGSLEFNSELLKIAENAQKLPRLCNHFHISLQSGSGETLRRMGRKYTPEEYYNGISLLRKNFENSAITTDIMVGFPGETQAEFNESMEFAKKVNFAKMHIFPYSIRKGTRAAEMDGQLTMKEKKERASLLDKIDKENVEAFSKAQLGLTAEVLFEQQKNDYYIGHTTNYLPVYVKSTEDIRYKIKKVEITHFSEGKLYGNIIL